mmetsp:Transcript_9398/g.23584  ORF Transcript_9398/g.23584 Transcript_9398/m.23584 type:complete len:464 (-) Transcript_9398:844-2235(-)
MRRSLSNFMKVVEALCSALRRYSCRVCRSSFFPASVNGPTFTDESKVSKAVVEGWIIALRNIFPEHAECWEICALNASMSHLILSSSSISILPGIIPGRLCSIALPAEGVVDLNLGPIVHEVSKAELKSIDLSKEFSVEFLEKIQNHIAELKVPSLCSVHEVLLSEPALTGTDDAPTKFSQESLSFCAVLGSIRKDETPSNLYSNLKCKTVLKVFMDGWLLDYIDVYCEEDFPMPLGASPGALVHVYGATKRLSKKNKIYLVLTGSSRMVIKSGPQRVPLPMTETRYRSIPLVSSLASAQMELYNRGFRVHLSISKVIRFSISSKSCRLQCSVVVGNQEALMDVSGENDIFSILCASKEEQLSLLQAAAEYGDIDESFLVNSNDSGARRPSHVALLDRLLLRAKREIFCVSRLSVMSRKPNETSKSELQVQDDRYFLQLIYFDESRVLFDTRQAIESYLLTLG